MCEKSGIRDNNTRGTIGAFLQENIQENSSLAIVSAYFTIYAFEALESNLLDIKEMRLLFGEPRFIRQIDPEKIAEKAFILEKDGLKLLDQLRQSQIAKACADWIYKKVRIKSVRQLNFLHGKLYHLTAHNGTEKAILGSSNFTLRGLGLTNTPNLELNLIVDSDRDRHDLKDWFDALWNDDKQVKDVTKEVLRYLEEIYKPTTPEFLYFKTLYHLFKQFIEEWKNTTHLGIKPHFFDTQIWNKLYDFQKDGVKNAITKLNRHNSCIIADSVGLGKTFEALAVIKHFETLNYHVLVLCPKKLRQNWTKYTHSADKRNPFAQDRFHYTVLSHTDLSREQGKVGDIDLANFAWGNFDLVVIDESHNFRNGGSRYNRLLEEVIKKEGNTKTKVLLLSATPVNTDLSDLRNQINFFTEGRDDAFLEKMGIRSVPDTLKSAQQRFKEWAEIGGKRDKSILLGQLGADFFKLLDELTIARSRRHIEQHYQSTMAELGQFPKRLPPLPIYSEIDQQKQFMSYKAVNDKISQYKLAVFNPSAYVKEEFFAKYKIKQVRQREYYLIGMIKVNFMKRLESSVYSFTLTLERTIGKIKDLEDSLHSRHNFDLSDNLNFAEEDEELEDAFQIGEQIGKKINPAHFDIELWLADLQEDRRQLQSVYEAAKTITVARDAKLAKLRELIEDKVHHPTFNKEDKPNRKVLVFTAFADTAQYLYNALSKWAMNDLKIQIALVSGSENKTTFGKKDFEEILTHFSPRSKERPSNEIAEIDLLIATDCISEGQNLQDCDYLVNYDIHWNPVRIIQRFGRIDRLNSLNKTVQLVNFWPTEDLDDYLNLKNRVEARMALVDVTATAADNLLAQEQEVQSELTFRDHQLKRLKEEVLDLEDFNETVTLNEFTLDDFRQELSDYLEKQERALKEAPLGLYAVVPPYQDDNWHIVPGVIFCLAAKETKKTTEQQTINPLYPFFLVYVLADGQIKYSFTRPKEILQTFQKLCIGKKEAYHDLCRLFDEITQDGKDLSFYNHLLEKAIASIARLWEKRNLSHLSTGRSGKLFESSQQLRQHEDFVLISWLIIK